MLLFNKISWVIILRFLQEALGDWLAQLCLITFYYMIGFRLEWTLPEKFELDPENFIPIPEPAPKKIGRPDRDSGGRPECRPLFWSRFLRPFPCDCQNIARGQPQNLCENFNLFIVAMVLKTSLKGCYRYAELHRLMKFDAYHAIGLPVD